MHTLDAIAGRLPLGGVETSLLQPNDLAKLLAGLRGQVACAPDLLRQAEVVVTFGGRLPFDLGRRSLTVWQRLVLEEVGRSCRAEPGEGTHPTSCLALGVYPFGRIFLGRAPVEGSRCEIFGWIAVPREALDRIEARARNERARTSTAAGVTRWFESIGPTGVTQVLDRITSALDQTDPVLFYMDEHAFGSSTAQSDASDVGDASAGVESIPSLLRSLRSRPPGAWREVDRSLVYCMHHTLTAGFRGEEFNGQQLSSIAVRELLDECGTSWSEACGEPWAPIDGDLADRAAAVLRLRMSMEKRWLFYRVVNGLNLHKAPRVLPRAAVHRMSPGELPDVVQSCLRRHDLDTSAFATTYDLVRAGLTRMLTETGSDVRSRQGGLHPIEELILVVAKAATDELASDFGMTRGLRDIAAIAEVHDLDRCEEAMAWPTSAYFCAVASGNVLATRDEGPVVPISRARRAISARMCFNGWHYMPGHFDLRRKPPGRHHYVPPRMPDVATWSDQRHAGHRTVRVRYSIRAPGPLAYRDRAFAGFYDLRLMRCAGSEYTLDEFRRALSYADTLGSVYQALLDHLTTTKTRFRVEAFTDAWYAAQGEN